MIVDACGLIIVGALIYFAAIAVFSSVIKTRSRRYGIVHIAIVGISAVFVSWYLNPLVILFPGLAMLFLTINLPSKDSQHFTTDGDYHSSGWFFGGSESVRLVDDEVEEPKFLLYPNIFLWGISSITIIVTSVASLAYYFVVGW